MPLRTKWEEEGEIREWQDGECGLGIAVTLLNVRGVTHTAESVSMAAVLANADQLLPEFRAVIEAMPAHERGPGIFVSEMFLFYSVVRPLNPQRILESGR